MAPFSSQGPTRDGRDKPDLVAPGVRILSARSRGLHDGVGPALATGAGLLTCMSGTSMAAPHVAGTLACVFEAAGRALHINETRRLLLANVVPAPAALDPITRARLGCGYLDVRAAIAAAARLAQAADAVPGESARVETAPLVVATGVLDPAAGCASTVHESPSHDTDGAAPTTSATSTPDITAADPPGTPAPAQETTPEAVGLEPPLVLLPELSMNDIDEASGCGSIDAQTLEAALLAAAILPTAWPRAEAIDEAAWMAEAEVSRDVRGRWRQPSFPFQIQLPINGGAPALALPLGGRNSPFASRCRSEVRRHPHQ